MQFLALCQEHYAVWSGNIHVAMLGILCSILAGSLVDVDLPLLKKHRGLGLLLAIVVVAMLAACSTKDSVSEVPDKDDSDAIVPPASVLPFADVVDLSEYFVDEPVEFSESTPKGELVCVNIDESQYSKADDTILLPNEKTKAMAVHCTWASASRTIYIGFIDEVSEEVYTLSAVGGALTGTLDLSSLPEGEYRPIMYSSDNQNINAVMLYQFQ